jgi:hypothetical protein
MIVRAKFKVDSIERQQWGVGQEVHTIKMSPVYKTSDPNDENSKFWKASPSGSIQLGCANPEAVKQFELGQEYYIDFTPAPKPD